MRDPSGIFIPRPAISTETAILRLVFRSQGFLPLVPGLFRFGRRVVEHLFGESDPLSIVVRHPHALWKDAERRWRDVEWFYSSFILPPSSFVSVTVIDKCGQATKGAGWMSWHREATKDAVACDKPGEAGKRALIPGFLNEETQLRNPQLLPSERIGRLERTQGTETSKYLQEKKETSIP